jgi:hypothetical protein
VKCQSVSPNATAVGCVRSCGISLIMSIFSAIIFYVLTMESRRKCFSKATNSQPAFKNEITSLKIKKQTTTHRLFFDFYLISANQFYLKHEFYR